MKAVMASSKLNGCRDTGFAFGMDYPPKATAIARSSHHILAENALPAAFSASRYHRTENVRVLAVVMPEREFRQIQRQVRLAHIMELTHHAPLQGLLADTRKYVKQGGSMATVLKQFHRGTNKPPQYLFSVPHYTGRRTVSGTEIVESDWFAYESAGVQHPGETYREARERKAKLRRVVKDAAIILAAVGLIVAAVAYNYAG